MGKQCKIFLAATIFGLAILAQAQEGGTLKKIKESNTIAIGHRESSVPFSYVDNNLAPIGFAMELCARVVDEIKKELALPALKVQYYPVTSQNRIPLVSNGTVDLECGSTTNNAERQKQVAFALSHFMTANKLLVKKNSGIKSLADLKGKTVVSTAGTTNERIMNKLNEDRKLGIQMTAAKDHGEAFLMVETGRAMAFAMDDVLLYGLIASSKAPGEYTVLSDDVGPAEPYGIMLRKDDPAFKQLVDRVLNRIYTSGEGARLYAKWFQSPIPPKNVNLNFPMSPELEAQFKNPNDKALESK